MGHFLLSCPAHHRGEAGLTTVPRMGIVSRVGAQVDTFWRLPEMQDTAGHAQRFGETNGSKNWCRLCWVKGLSSDSDS